ncbi:MAG: PIG-L deacetylase family protein [Chloroflexia bacterium]
MTSFSRRLARRAARRAVYPLVEMVTLAVLVGLQRLRRASVTARALPLSGGQRVLVVAAHPDDETIGCYATMLAHLNCGDTVRVLVVTDGSGSRAGGLTPAKMVERRRRELAQVALGLPGVELVAPALQEAHWQDEQLLPALEQNLAAWAPHIVYAPSCVEFHPEHLRVARVVARALACRPSCGEVLVRVYEMQVPLGPELVNMYTPLGERYEAKARAIATYRSQRRALDLWRREARYLGALVGAGGGAEGFWEMPASAYTRVIAAGQWTWRTSPFRSLTGRPLNDLTAYLRGRATRETLRRLAEGTDKQ